MLFPDKYYLDIGNATDSLLKSPRDRALFRFLEILPGALSWLTLIFVIICSWLAPVFAAFFIIAFDIYWLLKTMYFSMHLRSSYKRMKKALAKDWLVLLQIGKTKEKWQKIYHLVILPTYKESFAVISQTLEALAQSEYPKDKFIVILTTEERAGQEAWQTAEEIKTRYQGRFFKLFITRHPKDLPGELAGKGSNETWGARQAKKEIIDPLGLVYEDIVVSVFDVDTRVLPQYFACLTYNFLICDKPYRSSFQPVPLFNNNIWQAPAPSRVVATSCTFWQMMQQERPERLSTFSSQSMSFKALVEMDFWNKKNVSEDSRIFWRSLLYYDGDYQVVPLFYPVSMDANLAPSFWQTVANIYKQQRRWGWGVENVPYFIFGALKNKKMPWGKKLRHIFNQMEGFWSWATNALLIFMLGWLPLYLGGEKFNVMMLSYNLPRVTRIILTAAMVGMVTSAIYSTILLPARPRGHSWRKLIYMVVQWALLPLTIIVFGSFPGLESQTRLMLGKYMGFWVTPKARKTE